MARRGLDPALCAETVARLQELRLLDDRSYAEAYVRRRRDERGRLALRAELRRKGVAEALVEGVLAGDDDDLGLDDTQQLRAAAALLAKHAWRFEGRPGAAASGAGDALAADPDPGAAALDLRRRRARAASFLARRGFTPDIVSSALAHAFSDRDDD